MSLFRSKFTAIGLLAVFGLASCGDSGSKTNSTTADNDSGYNYGSNTTVADTTTATGDTTATTTADTTGVQLAAGDLTLTQSTFGPILSDRDGNTLYMYLPDTPDAATCTGGCAGAWPPYLADAETSVGEGTNGDLYGTVAGEGGTQLTYNGHPLYTFSGDSAAGDTNGQGSGGTWFVLDADGNQITA